MNFRSAPLKAVVFFISCVYVYGGSVNYGIFGFTGALPFLVFVLYAAFKWRGTYAAITVLLLLGCATLYYLKTQHGRLFHPALGREYFFKEDVCLTKYQDRNESTSFVLVSKIAPKIDCDSSDRGNAIKWTKLPKDSRLKVDAVSVSNADFGETYFIESNSDFGQISFYPYDDDLKAFWMDGKPLRVKDLLNPVFNIPSFFMAWPIDPLIPYKILWKWYSDE